MAQIYRDVAGICAACGELKPTHCDVRVNCNEMLQSYHRDGFAVRWDYCQDRAFSTVRRLLSLRSN